MWSVTGPVSMTIRSLRRREYRSYARSPRGVCGGGDRGVITSQCSAPSWFHIKNTMRKHIFSMIVYKSSTLNGFSTCSWTHDEGKSTDNLERRARDKFPGQVPRSCLLDNYRD